MIEPFLIADAEKGESEMVYIMEHKPLISFNDGMEITYSDLKTDERGEYVTIYFERPNRNGNDFDSAQIDYPVGKLKNIIGFEIQDYAFLKDQIERNGKLALSFAKEDDASCVHNDKTR